MSIFTLKKSVTAKVASAFIGGAMALTLVFGGAVAPTQAQTVDELSAWIESLFAQIATLQTQLSGMSGTTGTVSYNFTANLSQGDSGADVLNLQKVLNMSTDTQVAATGVGSTGLETEYFGGLTKAAVIKFQDKYASEVLTPVGLTAGTGFVGPSTRDKLNTMTAGTVPTTPTTTLPAGCTSATGYSPTSGLACNGTTGAGTTPTTPAGTGLTVTPGVQPTATLAVKGAARVPFTTVVLTASADGDVVVNSLLIQRDALSQDAAFAGIVLLDSDGTQLGIAKTLNSLHQATIGEAFTVKAGTSKTVTVAANMNTDLSSYDGQIGSLEVMSVNTSATVNGTFPIQGASHAMNDSLSIGTATVTRGIDDPNTSADKEVGTTGYTFASVKVTGALEKIRIHSLRWNQSGSVASSDLDNLKTYVDGTAYDLTVSVDGKYYTANFGEGIVVSKGQSKEISIKGDIVGGSGRTIIFDIYKDTDLYITGEDFNYGITPAESGGTAALPTSSQMTDDSTPFFDNAHVTVSSGSLSASKSTSVEAQNVAENVADQVLGGFDIEAKGESITVAKMIFQVVTSSGGGAAEDITNISLVDGNGSVVAGPVEGVGTGESGTVTFTDTVTFPVGEGTYTLTGQLGTDFINDETVYVTTTPGSNWTTVTGETTGDSITPTPAGLLTSNTMTLKAGTVSISVSDSPVAQNVVGGAQNFTFANYQFDASASGEDIRFTSLILELVATAGSEYLTGCQLWDGDTVLNTGSNKKDVASGLTTTSDMTFTLDSGGVTIPKGTVKTLALKCDLSSSAVEDTTYTWDMTNGTDQTGTGLNSGTTITVGNTTGAGQTMTAKDGGSLAVTEESGSYTVAAAGTSDVTLGSLKFTGTNEEITLNKLGLILTDASSTPSNLDAVTLWDGTKQVGKVIFAGESNYATSTIGAPYNDFIIPKDGTKTMTIKGDLAEIGITGVGTQGALFIANWNGDGTSTTGTGDQSGGTVTASGSTTTFDGVRVFRSYPTFAKNDISNDEFTSGGKTVLYRFSVSANEGDGSSEGIGIHKFVLSLATSSDSATQGSTTVTDLRMYAYTDSGFSSEVEESANNVAYVDGLIVTAIPQPLGTNAGVDNDLALINPLQIPEGETYYFEVTGVPTHVAGTATTNTGQWVKTYIQGDAAYNVNSARLLDITTTIDDDDNDDFIWSPYATTTSGDTTHYDWTNGYKVEGLSSLGMEEELISLK